MTLLVMNDTGYRNLIQLVSRSFQEGQQEGKALVHRHWLEDYHHGLIALSGANYGDIGYLLLNRDQAAAGKKTRQLAELIR